MMLRFERVERVTSVDALKIRSERVRHLAGLYPLGAL